MKLYLFSSKLKNWVSFCSKTWQVIILTIWKKFSIKEIEFWKELDLFGFHTEFLFLDKKKSFLLKKLFHKIFLSFYLKSVDMLLYEIELLIECSISISHERRKFKPCVMENYLLGKKIWQKISQNSHLITNEVLFFFEFQYQCECEDLVVFQFLLEKKEFNLYWLQSWNFTFF